MEVVTYNIHMYSYILHFIMNKHANVIFMFVVIILIHACFL